MIYEVLGVTTGVAWNESIFPNSHRGIISFPSPRLQMKTWQNPRPVQGLYQCVLGGRVRSRRLCAPGDGEWLRDPALPVAAWQYRVYIRSRLLPSC